MKKKTKIFACAMAGINIFLAVLCSGCVPSSQFTEEEHLSRLNDCVERKLSESEIEYTEFKIYPVYDENDKFGYVLVELEPKGYFYIEISVADTSLLGGARMYLVESNAIDQEKWGITELDSLPHRGRGEETFHRRERRADSILQQPL